MKVMCIANTGKSLPDAYLDIRVGYHRDKEFAVTVGKQYVVYGVAYRDAQVWYYVSHDVELYYPIERPAPLFEVVDDRLSKYWRYGFTPGNRDHLAILSFQEWVSDKYFYDRLTNRDESEVSIFQKMKELMDSEANGPEEKR